MARTSPVLYQCFLEKSCGLLSAGLVVMIIRAVVALHLVVPMAIAQVEAAPLFKGLVSLGFTAM
jgi:hypothetical protein